MAPKAKSGGKGGKGGGESGGDGQSLWHGKAYKDAVQELFSSTALQPRDVDQKAIQLLDALHKVGKAEAGCQHLKTSLENVTREKVQNWRAYSYSLLRAFDADVYSAMKEKSGGNRQRGGSKNKGAADGKLNPNPVEFQPGQWWQGDHAKGTLAPAGGGSPMGAGYPMNMMNMMMMPQMQQMAAAQAAAAAPPPPPTKAAAVPKAEGKEAPVPEKAADETVAKEAKEGDKPADKAEPAAAAEAAR